MEIVGLSFSCLRDLARLGPAVYPYQDLEEPGGGGEIVGLNFSCLRDLARLGPAVYPYQDLEEPGGGGGERPTLGGWADRIRGNFENHFWIGAKGRKYYRVSQKKVSTLREL